MPTTSDKFGAILFTELWTKSNIYSYSDISRSSNLEPSKDSSRSLAGWFELTKDLAASIFMATERFLGNISEKSSSKIF